jgi:hypothetical protein
VDRRPVSRNLKVSLIAVAMIVLILLAAQCAYGAGDWAGTR